MSTEPFKAGDIVKISYKSGEYIGEVFQYAVPKAVIKILAVLKHPEQGDLHHPMEVDVPMFHQRRALAFQEKALTSLSMIQHYPYKVPDYNESLQQALESEMTLLHKTELWARRCKEELASLQQEYFK